MVTKSEIRRRMRHWRRSLSAEQQARAQEGLGRHISRLPAFLGASHVGIYWPMNGEISPLGLVAHPLSRHKTYYLPALAGSHLRELRFAPFRGRWAWRQNGLGIPEPQSPRRLWRSARELDLLVIPMLAFDSRGHRLGMGGGYYDRTLKILVHRQYWRRPRLVGAAHAFQECPEIPAEPWDVSLPVICTELGCRCFPA